MMKSMRSIIILGLCLFLFADAAQARTPLATSSARQEKRVEQREDRLEKREERMEQREDRRDELSQKHADRLANRFTFYAKRLSNIIERTQNRLNTLKVAGKNTAIAQATLDSAKAELVKANTAKEKAVNLFQAISTTEKEDKKAAIEAAQTAAQDARKLFLSTHKLLKQSITEMRAL